MGINTSFVQGQAYAMELGATVLFTVNKTPDGIVS
ncbi:hypothetical protein MUK42_16752 [Musa troglodytarum]|uniref:Uncharacterized protein n=1 Tax=Musa troglodytarum TaxID=320322 RepID=A0A9E7GCU9_9LILI|nr:hypothetical protein MUK42_16752 [Musa troglodytarum]